MGKCDRKTHIFSLSKSPSKFVFREYGRKIGKFYKSYSYSVIFNDFISVDVFTKCVAGATLQKQEVKRIVCTFCPHCAGLSLMLSDQSFTEKNVSSISRTKLETVHRLSD